MKMTRFLIFKDCEPVKVWLLSRHGAAYPSNSTMDELSKLDEVSK